MPPDRSDKTNGEAADLEILFPEITIEVICPDSQATVSVTVGELSLISQLRVQADARNLIAALSDAGTEGETDPTLIDKAIGGNAEEWLSAIAMATGQPVTWLGRLRGRDAMRLSDAMWELNGVFFVTKAVVRNLIRAKASNSEQSSTSSSVPDTEQASDRSLKNTRKGRSRGSGK